MKPVIIALLCICTACTTFAQSYRTPAGIRLGTEIGLTVQQLVFDRWTVEGLFHSRVKTDEVAIAILMEKHHKLLFRRVNFYVGGGIHKGWNTSTEETYGDPAGVSGIAGAEITLGNVNLSWDFQPAFNIFGGDRFVESQTAISIRYVFLKRKKKKINWKFWEKKDKGKKKKKRK